MIIKKKRLNKISGLGDIQEDQIETSSPEEISGEDSSGGYEQNSKNEDEYTLDNAVQDEVQPQLPAETKSGEPDDIDLFNLDNIDFTQRQERRKGDRRRGFRRIDDRNLVSRAREEADAIRESAMNEGYQAGLQRAEEDLAELRDAISKFMISPNEVYEYIAPDILEISVDIAQKIIKKEIEQDPQVLFGTIVDVLKMAARDEPKVTLQVNPAEANEVKQAIPELLNIAGVSTKIIVTSNEEITEGGCLVVTDNGVVDATIETRVNLIIEALRE